MIAGPTLRAAVAVLAAVCCGGVALAADRTCGDKTPVKRLDELGPAIFACWSPPAGSQGKHLTLRFSLRRDGTLIGKPQATYAKFKETDGSDRKFVASVLVALDKALPLPLTPGLGGAIAGRPMTLRFAVETGTGI